MSTYPQSATPPSASDGGDGADRTVWSVPQVLALVVELGFVGWMLCQHQSLATALEAAGGSTAIVLGVGGVPAVLRKLTGKAAG